ncbi:hypothetical protein [Ornithinimicrobium cryptoxanthini]|uniref:Uncharacterized protein n=1 Tax=Ornithinimicrobium cryptoxanthini TaxID=2934161 RepID=A0ABY4YFA7_9MICO|nr:hypothetical protein [Ornithinimicrobium cryptoxanthini]USQ75216.1 hypothetical protein NF557_11320 [Ornithinimicrobium cryptoxanthini]
MSSHRQQKNTPDEAPDSTEPYDPEQDPDADPEMLTSQHPALTGENERDPAEGPDDESTTGE